LHLVGILFTHINDDARSKSHQINNICLVFEQPDDGLLYTSRNTSP